MTYISKLITFLLYELEGISHMLFCRASFAASFYHIGKFLKMCFNIKKLIIQIESGLLGHPLYNRYGILKKLDFILKIIIKTALNCLP